MAYLDHITCKEAGYYHNQSCRFTDGALCETCNAWVGENTLDYFLLYEATSICYALHNRGARGEKLPRVLLELKDKLDDRDYLYSLSEEAALSLWEETKRLLSEFGVRSDEATIEF